MAEETRPTAPRDMAQAPMQAANSPTEMSSRGVSLVIAAALTFRMDDRDDVVAA